MTDDGTDRPPCEKCGKPGWSYTVCGSTASWFPTKAAYSPGVNFTSSGPTPRFVRYCTAHALSLLGVAAHAA